MPVRRRMAKGVTIKLQKDRGGGDTITICVKVLPFVTSGVLQLRESVKWSYKVTLWEKTIMDRAESSLYAHP